jgi:hypothetical protein
LASTFHPDYNPMIRKLESIFTLSDDERQALETLPMQVAVIKADQDIVGSAQDLCPIIRLARTDQKPSRDGLAD